MKSHHRFGQPGAPALLLLVLLLLAASPVSAGAPDQPDFPPAIVRCDPSYAEGYTDGTITIDLYLEDTENTYGIDAHVSYDTTIARVVDKNTAIPGTQIEPLYSWVAPGLSLLNVACNPGDPVALQCSTPADVGVISYAMTQLNPTPPLNGSGPFARVTFQPLTFGTFTMNFIYHKLSSPEGVEVPSIAEDCTIKFMSPLAVNLASFTAAEDAAGVTMRWETISEQHNRGFNVLRASSVEGPWRQLNPTLIPAAAPGSNEGHSYTWQDPTIERGQTYYYMLEDVSIAGVTTRHEPLEVRVQVPNAVGLSAFSGQARGGIFPALLAGLALCLVALRRMRASA